MEDGLLDRRDSLNLLDDLDFGIMDLGMSDEESSETIEPVRISERHQPSPLKMPPTNADVKAEMASAPIGQSIMGSGIGDGASASGSAGGGEKVLAQGGGGLRGGDAAVKSFGGGGGPADSQSGQHANESEHEIDVSCFLIFLPFCNILLLCRRCASMER